MITPYLSGVTQFLAAIPIFELEPVVTPSESGAPADGACTAAVSPQPGDADGVNDQVAMRLVFKGYRYESRASWTLEANRSYDSLVDAHAAHDRDRAQADERAREAARRAAAAVAPDAAAPDAEPI